MLSFLLEQQACTDALYHERAVWVELWREGVLMFGVSVDPLTAPHVVSWRGRLPAEHIFSCAA